MLITAIRTLISGGQVSFLDILAQVVSVLFVIFCILPLHEFAHAWVANKLGDPTAKYNGRITINPLASVDPMGALMLLLVGFGWARPVPVNPNYFKKPKRDMALTALAGPVSNLLSAFVGAVLYLAVIFYMPAGVFARFLSVMLNYYVVVNVSLAVFNFIPIPPLDGSRILGAFLSDRLLAKYYSYQSMLSMLLMVMLVTGALSGPLATVQNFFLNIIVQAAFFPFRFFLG